MKKQNHHTHTTISDGKLTPEELVKLAIKKKFDTLAITDHYRLPPGFRDWGNERYSHEDYTELVRLKKKYSKKINILIGVEFDWIEKYKKWTIKEVKRRKYDLKLISVHFLEGKKEYIPIDWKDDEGFGVLIKDYGGIKNLVRYYYRELRKAVKTNQFDVVAHFDIIKLWNKENKYFSDEEEWYKKEVTKTLKVIKKYNMKLDLNMSGLRKACVEQYPSLKIIKEARKMNIPFLIGTDTHKPEHLEWGLKEGYKILKTLK